MKRWYNDHNLSAKSLARIDQANAIITEYAEVGDKLTIRQLYYQHVARDMLDNTERNYQNLITLMTKAREAGLVDWRAIEDRHRSHRSYYHQESADNVVTSIDMDISFDYWSRQDTYVEVWIEKDALGGVIQRPCERLHVPYMACKGYMSASHMWRAGRRFLNARELGKRCVLIHLGDHDPSGMDMTRDNADRLWMFAEGKVEVRRIALNIDQVEEHNPPPNPTKLTDSRAAEYVQDYGDSSWELDALEPRLIRELVEDEVRLFIDDGLWQETAAEEEREAEVLTKLAANWTDIRQFIEENFD